MSTPSLDRVPLHLRKYVTEQHYERYTPEEQATWRHLLHQLRDFLSRNAHECYVEGLKKTGIDVERIPRIQEMDLLLQNFGWGAVPVSGFIPPAAFMEFQSLSILPIASDMRTVDHMLYTPAPDIVHEAAGHAPILIHPEYADYLKSYAQVAKKSIISREDLNQYEAIRKLSDIKESPTSTPEQIRAAEAKLNEVNAQISHVSEAALLSRMNWWTAEYGLVGNLKDPKIYGAGLLSSLGESRECLTDKVKKIPLDVSCVDVSYDITEPQPQLFVTPDFRTLNVVLEELSKRLSYRRGGVFGLKNAVKAQSPNTVELNSGLQISGILENFFARDEQVDFLKFKGPCQLAFRDHQLKGHGPQFHAQGFSTPLGPLKGLGKSLNQCSKEDFQRLGCTPGKKMKLEYASGFIVEGLFKDITYNQNQPLIISLIEAHATWKGQVYFEPSWGQYDIACGHLVTSVFGGPADRKNYGEVEDFLAERVPTKQYSSSTKARFDLFQKTRELREGGAKSTDPSSLWQSYLKLEKPSWLLAQEILELAEKVGNQKLAQEIKAHL